jgi:hypothetical protein
MTPKHPHLKTRRSAHFAAVVITICAGALGACTESTTASTSAATKAVKSTDSTDSIMIESTVLAPVDSAETTVTTTPEFPATTQLAAATPAAGKAFTDCLAENGVLLPPGFALPSAAGAGGTPEIPEGVDLGKLQIAMGKCQDKMPAAAGGQGTAGAQTEPFIQCLRENGVAIPANATLAQVPAGNPAFEAANTACESLLPSTDGAAATTTNP